MKGEERVCHVTEADRLGAAKAVRLSEKVSSCEAALRRRNLVAPSDRRS